MRPGFLVQQRGDRQQCLQHASARADAPSVPPAAARPSPTPAPAAAGLEQCLELLRGPSDERRFVGLLLVTKLLPAGDARTVRQVHAAVGPTFLARLLLPLKSTTPLPTLPAGPEGEAAAQKEAATCALGLAVLSSFARLPELAASHDVVETVPLLLNVVRAGGVAPLLASRRAASAAGTAAARASPAAAADAAADGAAVQDALETVVAVARSGAEGAEVAAASGAVAAAAAALKACPPEAAERMSLAVQLLAAVLNDEGRRAALLAGEQDLVLSKLLPALARVFGLPAEQLAAGPGKAGAAAAEEQRQRRLLALQLEALHVLLLLLPLPHLPPGAAAATLPSRDAAWPAQLRRGLTLLLRGRVSAVQRHSALQLAAAVVDLLGPAWLLGGPFSSGSRSGSRPASPLVSPLSGSPGAAAAGASLSAQAAADGQGAEEAQAFFQVLLEVANVETSVLLHDALAPAVPVPLAAAPGLAAPDWRPPAPRGQLAAGPGSEGGSGGEDEMDGNHAAGAELAADLAGGSREEAADVEPLVKVLSSEADRKEFEQQLERDRKQAAAGGGGGGQGQVQPGEHMRQVDATPIPEEMRWEGPSEAAGERAARVLPCCLALLEACIEALAEDTQRAEAMLDGLPAPPTPPSPGEPFSFSLAGPVLSDSVAQRSLLSLEEAAEVVLQFVEQTAEGLGEEEAEEEGAEGEGLLRRMLLLAALRLVARFCAEVPDAFGARLRPLLPHLLPLRLDLGGESATGIEIGSTAISGDEEEGTEAEEGGAPPLRSPAEGTTFLLPLLLQATNLSPPPDGSLEAWRRERRAWVDALSSPQALRQLSQYAQSCAAACFPAVTTAVAAAADDALLYACDLLLNVLAGEEDGASADASHQQQQRRRQRVAFLAAGEPLALLGELLNVVRMRPIRSVADCSPAEVASVARLLSGVAALCAVVAASVAGQLHSGGPESAELGLELTVKQQQQRVQEEQAEEERLRRRLGRRQGLWRGRLPAAAGGASGSPLAPRPPPFLGPISGRTMAALCAELLSSIQVTAQLAAACPLGGEGQLAPARAAIFADPALRSELLRHLEITACEAAVLLRHYQPFQAMCRDSAWLAAELAARQQAGGGGEGAAEECAGLARLLDTLAEAEQEDRFVPA